MIFNMTGGGSNPLNFEVKTYQSETDLKADKPKENTIGVITTTTMTSWVFSATEPTEPKTGMVWIAVGASSSVEFNALKNNTLQVYPLKAKQYEGGEWVGKEAKSYQNGKWVDWIIYFIRDGIVVNSEKWTKQALKYTSDQGGVEPTVTQNDENVTISVSGSWKTGIYFISEKEDLTNVKKLHVKGSASAAEGAGVNLEVWDGIGSYVKETRVATVNIGSENNEYVLDVSSLKGKYNIGFSLIANGTSKATIIDFWRE